MLATKTVFVLGAGASCELGFPAGPELANRIAAKLKFDVDTFPHQTNSGDKEVFQTLLRISAFKKANTNYFFSGAKRICEGIEYSTSIDSFIDVHRNDKSVELCGKVAIARSILEAERSSAIFLDNSNAYSNFQDVPTTQASWMQRFIRLVQV